MSHTPALDPSSSMGSDGDHGQNPVTILTRLSGSALVARLFESDFVCDNIYQRFPGVSSEAEMQDLVWRAYVVTSGCNELTHQQRFLLMR